jgi:hypothetical protein
MPAVWHTRTAKARTVVKAGAEIRANRRSDLIERHPITDGLGALAALVILLPRITSAIGASAQAWRVRAKNVPCKCGRGKRNRVREIVTTRW